MQTVVIPLIATGVLQVNRKADQNSESRTANQESLRASGVIADTSRESTLTNRPYWIALMAGAGVGLLARRVDLCLPW
jgi:hypothetical protein